MERLVIDRAKWRVGGSMYSPQLDLTFLLNPNSGMMCCLGFYCIWKGVPEEDIEGRGRPDGVVETNPRWLPELSLLVESGEDGEYLASEIAVDLIHSNDSPFIDNDTREKEIKEHFLKIGVEVEFIGEFPPFYGKTQS